MLRTALPMPVNPVLTWCHDSDAGADHRRADHGRGITRADRLADLPGSVMTRVTDTRDLTTEQKAKLAYALAVIRSNQSLRGWSQYRLPETGNPQVLRLMKRSKDGRLAQVYHVVK